MKCPQCKSEFGTPRIISKTEGINACGNPQLTLETEIESYVKWDPTSKTYSCSKCGHVFSFREAVLQKP